MSDTKWKLAFFTIPEYEKEQEWLAKQHRAGWKLKRFINWTITKRGWSIKLNIYRCFRIVVGNYD